MIPKDTLFFLLSLALAIPGCNAKKTPGGYASESLVIEALTGHVFQHTSFLDAGSFGVVPCNGMIVFDGNEAVIFDTPANEEASVELIQWVESELGCKITAVIPTHFHADCLAGLDVFHRQGIPSYANARTIALAQSHDKTLPQNGFDDSLELEVDDEKVYAVFFGEGHTRDNVIGYFPSENVMFGGCLIKASGAGKGNLEDANVADWPITVSKIKEKHQDVNMVIPGHGNAGGVELFDYTIQLFTEK